MSDPWIRACTFFVIGKMKITDLAELARDAEGEDQPVVSEMARWASARLGET